MCRLSLAASAAVLVLVATPVAWADSLDDARAAVDASDYVTARALLEQALTSGVAGPAELSEIYKLGGVVEGALGNEKPATDAFARWLALEPKATLPVGTSPKIMRPFTAAADKIKSKGAIEAKAETADDPPSVSLVIVNDPLKMIVGAKVTFTVDRGPEQTLEADGKRRITLELGIGKRIDLRLHAIDRHGNRVVDLGSKDVPIVITSSGKRKPIIDPKDPVLMTKREPEPRDGPRPWYLKWWVWGIATGVATGTGGYFAWRTYDAVEDLNHLNANSLAHPFADAQDAESRARRDLLATNIAAGVAGAFAIGTAILFFTRPTVNERAATIAVTPTPGGGALVLGRRF